MVCPIESGAELIVAYCAGTLAPEKRAEFEQHLALCAKCRRTAEAQHAVWSALDAWTPVDVSAGFDQKLYQRIAAQEQRAWWPHAWRQTWSWRPVVPVAAACAALVAAFLIKSPELHQVTPSQNEPKLQIEQVEHALDDLEMLKQLSVDGATDSGHAEKI